MKLKGNISKRRVADMQSTILVKSVSTIQVKSVRKNSESFNLINSFISTLAFAEYEIKDFISSQRLKMSF